MSRIIGVLNIEFETYKTAEKKQFELFKHRLGIEMESAVENLAEECGFGSNEIHPVLIDWLDLRGDE